MVAGTRRQYTEDFKREAVRLVRESAHPVAQVARDLGIPENVLYRCRAQHQQAEAHGTDTGRSTRRGRRTRTREMGVDTGDPGTGFFETCGLLREGVPMRYRAIHEHDRRDPIRLMCRALAVSPEGIRAKTVKKCRATTQSNHRMPVAANALNRQFTVAQPNQMWAGDVTYVWTTKGWLYLAVVLDLYLRFVIGWALEARLTVDLAERALTMALANRTPTAGLLHHSDRGSQYAATSHQRLLDERGIATTMSRKGNCWDNACVESFFGTLKRELVYHRRYATREEATQDIFAYIEVFYNRRRRHSTLGYYSPAEFEARTAVV